MPKYGQRPKCGQRGVTKRRETKNSERTLSYDWLYELRAEEECAKVIRNAKQLAEAAADQEAKALRVLEETKEILHTAVEEFKKKASAPQDEEDIKDFSVRKWHWENPNCTCDDFVHDINLAIEEIKHHRPEFPDMKYVCWLNETDYGGILSEISNAIDEDEDEDPSISKNREQTLAGIFFLIYRPDLDFLTNNLCNVTDHIIENNFEALARKVEHSVWRDDSEVSVRALAADSKVPLPETINKATIREWRRDYFTYLESTNAIPDIHKLLEDLDYFL